MNDLKIIDDERDLVWYPSVVNMGEKGIIYMMVNQMRK